MPSTLEERCSLCTLFSTARSQDCLTTLANQFLEVGVGFEPLCLAFTTLTTSSDTSAQSRAQVLVCVS